MLRPAKEALAARLGLKVQFCDPPALNLSLIAKSFKVPFGFHVSVPVSEALLPTWNVHLVILPVLGSWNSVFSQPERPVRGAHPMNRQLLSKAVA